MTENEIIDKMSELMFTEKNDKLILTEFGFFVCVALGYKFVLNYFRRLKNEKDKKSL